MSFLWLLFVSCLVASASSQRLRQRPGPDRTEPAPVYPTYPEITKCPEEYGLQLYHHPYTCEQFYKCANGTLTLETCENGLLFDGRGAVHNYCNYHWAVDCEGRENTTLPIARGPCDYAFGLFPAGPCEDHYIKCEYAEPLYDPCTPGLAYDERIHGCNWPDLMEKTCDAAAFLGFECPTLLPSNHPASKFWPFPRFAAPDCSKYFICVENKPRLIGCGDYNVFNEATLTCDDPEYVPHCAK